MSKILHSMIVRMIRMYKKRKKKIFKISQAQVSQESDVSFIEDRNHVCWRREVFQGCRQRCEPHEWARDLRTAIRSCRTWTMKHSPETVLPSFSIAPRPSACRISIGDELLGRGPLFSGIFQAFQKADPWIFRDRIPLPIVRRIESENQTRCFPGIHWIHWIDIPIMGRENFVIPRLLWKSHSKLSRNENFPILSYTFVPATLPLL